MDSVSFAGHITFAILAEGRPSLSLIVPAFLACLVFVHEAQFSVLIHQIQGPENYTPPSVPPPPAQPTAATVSNVQPPLLPISYPPPPATPPATLAQTTPPQPAATNNNPSPTFFAFVVQHIRTDPQARLWFILFIFLTLIVRVILSPMLSMCFVAITYSCIWLPQIVRSARRGRTSGFTKEYILGTTACRLFGALYFLACPKNVLEVEPRPWVYFLTLFVFTQAFVLILQDEFGPTFFLPARYAAVASYDYHPPLPLPNSESLEKSLGDCAICMDTIMIDPYIGVNVATARKHYSLAPCSHLFHTECLEKWLAIKNICPQCRRPLPPL